MYLLNRQMSKVLLGGILVAMSSTAPALANPAAAGAAASASGGSPVSAQVTVDANKIGEDIANAISSADNRDAFVKDVRNRVYYRFKEEYNVMVFNLNQDHWHDLEGVVHYESANYHGIPYGVWVFERGVFQNKGDGGYINWAFAGERHRSGDGGKWVDFW